ncbi:hypothetical protein MLD38_006402 [Melastoma candidum]|uniref:Uncharacterized protein n=1 Tax=Melastoma candidum TaxID=119954 RepID=A0ACB9RP12_9MYRT|nr:hypothetical protein MLD38_006402 [Melastoma candidum]
MATAPTNDDNETDLLLRLAANHLHLAQFEPLRAVLLTLRSTRPDLASSFLLTVIAHSPRLDRVLWSPSCPNPALLAYLSVLELLVNHDAAPALSSSSSASVGAEAWRFDKEPLKLRVEFVLYVQRLMDGVTEAIRKVGDSKEGSEEDMIRRLRDCIGVLGVISQLGWRRVRRCVLGKEGGDETGSAVTLGEADLSCLQDIVWEFADVFYVLCDNIRWHIKGCEVEGDSLALTVHGGKDVLVEQEDGEELTVMGLIQRSVQVAHLDAMKECLTAGDEDGAIDRVRFLHLGYGVDEAEYRFVFHDLLKRIISLKEEYGGDWLSMRKRLLKIYTKALESNCVDLTRIIQAIHDQLVSVDFEGCGSHDSQQLPPALDSLQKYLMEQKADTDSKEEALNQQMAVKACLRDMYHYTRVHKLHVLECVMENALSAVRRQQLQEASNILRLYPKLKPLVAVMGWDILSGDAKARRTLMQLLWTSVFRVVPLDSSSSIGNGSDEISCVDHLCDSLCYQLDIASFVACINSGHKWKSEFSILFPGKEAASTMQDSYSDPFVEKFVLERLSVQSPLRVLFDVVPGIRYEDAIQLISLQPTASTLSSWKRMQDIELMHMRYALESAVLALGTIDSNSLDERDNHCQEAFCYLNDLQNHLEAIMNIPRKIFMANAIISLLHMDDLSINSTHCASPESYPEKSSGHSLKFDCPTNEGGNKIVITFTGLLLDILRRNLPSSLSEMESVSDGNLSTIGKQALEWRISTTRSFIEDWEWRLSILQRLLPLYERQWRWKEALVVLRAAPSKLLNLCMQRAKYDLGEEAVQRFSLSAEDKATLELAEWVDNAFERASVEDAVSRAADGTSLVQEGNLGSLRLQLGPLAAILLCMDIAATSAKQANMCLELLNQAQLMLSEIYPGGSPKTGSNYWNQIQEIGVISVSRRILKRFQEFLEQAGSSSLQSILCGEFFLSSSEQTHRYGQKERAIALLNQMIEDAHKGKRQFLSGKLHNLARAIADEEANPDSLAGEGVSPDRRVLLNAKKDCVLGLGLQVAKQTKLNSVPGDTVLEPANYDNKDSGKRYFGPLSSKPSTYLSQFILHIAAIGDIVDGTDTTHDFNFFSVVYEWPKDLLTRLVFDRGSTDAAAKAAEIMRADFVHEVISASVPPVYPPRAGNGWACIPILPFSSKSILENKDILLSSKETNKSFSSHPPMAPGLPLYPLQLDIIKHLVKISPVRAVLACVFGSSILYGDASISSSPNSGILRSSDTDRLFYEFALDQSERFPTLNRWIQMQTNLHRVSEFAETTDDSTADVKRRHEQRDSVKRVREHTSDLESEFDECGGSSSNTPRNLNRQGSAVFETWHNSPESEVANSDATVYFSFDSANEEPYEKAVQRLIDEGKLMDAVALSDRFLRNGASDHLLQLLIEGGEENVPIGSQNEVYGGQMVCSNSWQYCLRLKDKHLAARLALKYMHGWELDAALDVLTMCSCHLTETDALSSEIFQMRQSLQRYARILVADDRYSSWQEVEASCKGDPEGLALRLAERGAVSAALEVAESAGLSLQMRRELQGQQLVKLLTADPLNGGGPAEASRFLSSLRDSEDALPVAMGAMQLLANLRSKQILVHFFLKRKGGNLSDADVSRLNLWALGLRVLAALPLPWQQRCSSLHEHPHLILEVLLMRKQLESASLIIKEFPSLRDSAMIVAYAAKAIAVNISSPNREPRISISGIRPKSRTRTGASSRSSFSSSLTNLQKEARRAFSWGPRNIGEKSAPKEVHRKRKNSGLSPSEKVAWEAMTGIQEDTMASISSDGQDRLLPVSIADEWILTGDAAKDEALRSSHRYESAPDINLFKALLSLCSDELVSAKSALDLCVSQMKNVLSHQQLPETSSMEIIGRAYRATETFVQGLFYAKSLIKRLAGGSDLSSNSERNTDDASSDAGSSSVGSQSTDELSELLIQADMWLGRAELLQSLLGYGIAASLEDIADKESSARLRDRLIADERYSMAVYTCKKCKIDVFPVWNAWGHALIRMEHYAQARVKFKQALQLHKGDPAPVILEIINTIEGGPPVDVSAVRTMFDHLAKSAPAILDDSLSTDSYLNVLYMPSTFPRSERSRRSLESANSSGNSWGFEDGPRSNLDTIRYTECVNYFQEYARQHLLTFMFRHGHFDDACALFFPPNAVPPPPQPSTHGLVTTTTSSPQRPDPLATDYGTIDDLCDLCVGYGAMPVLEEVISARMSTASSQDPIVNQHTTAAISRICIYCETHRHFNYLYKFQVIKKDHVAAGLCCLQLFMNSSSQDEAVKHLEHAKVHFDEGLSARYKGGDATKLITKGLKGKSASEKLTEEGLVKFSARVAIQMDVVKSFNDPDGPQWKHSLFGNPIDPDTFRRRCVIAETLAERNFDLAFRVIYEFNLPAVDIYAGVAASLADRKRGGQLTEFFKNIKGTIDDEDWDQVLGAAINVYANKHKERPDRLIDMLTSIHRKVLSCVVCGRLKTAFQIASRSGSVADVQYVAHQALHANAFPVLDMCKQWLSQYM